MSAADLAAYVSPGATLPALAAAFVGACWDQAAVLVAQHVGGTYAAGPTSGEASVTAAAVPDPILGRAILEVGAELYHRRQAPSGITQFATPDGASAVRVARDPMVAAYPLLVQYAGRGVA